MPFRKVQYRKAHAEIEDKFFVSEVTLARWPDVYKAVDKTVYGEPGPVEYAAPQIPADVHSAVVAPAQGFIEEGESLG